MASMLVANRAARPDQGRGFQRMFAPGRMTLGVFFPIEAFQGDQPAMRKQEQLAQRAEDLGFAALWFRDVPLRDPSFGDIGQVYDPWVYIGWIAAQTREIALVTGSLVITLRHPLHTAKASASVDRLSNTRLVLGIASGDRPVEFPAFGVDFEQRSALFRENLRVIRTVLFTYPHGIQRQAEVGRKFLSNPDLPEHFRLHAELNPDDPSTYYGNGAIGYTDYPTLRQLSWR
jgi:luciferase-type oxidoreductase